jgi:hypothetical protein
MYLRRQLQEHPIQIQYKKHSHNEKEALLLLEGMKAILLAEWPK